MDIPIVVDESGKKIFTGKEDPTNPPIFVKNPNVRMCKVCHKESGNDKTQCDYCQHMFDDGKMECQFCHKFFDYLVGDDDNNGGKRGCESCWKPPSHPAKGVGSHVVSNNPVTFDP